MRPQVKMFRSTMRSWNALFDEAAGFATEIGPRRLIGFGHSEDKDDGVVTVWFWDGGDAEPAPPLRARFKVFRNAWTSWESLFEEAADAAEEIGPTRLIGISHSEDKDDGVVAVWFWEDAVAADSSDPVLSGDV